MAKYFIAVFLEISSKIVCSVFRAYSCLGSSRSVTHLNASLVKLQKMFAWLGFLRRQALESDFEEDFAGEGGF